MYTEYTIIGTTGVVQFVLVKKGGYQLWKYGGAHAGGTTITGSKEALVDEFNRELQLNLSSAEMRSTNNDFEKEI